jgi:mannose-6-phosphate isomerase-like protein (cupin superfamily)
MAHIGERLHLPAQVQGPDPAPRLATAAGISKGDLSKIERTSKLPVFSPRQTLAAILDADIGEFLTGDLAPAVSLNLELHGPDDGAWLAAHKLGGYDLLPLLKSYRHKGLSPALMRVRPGTTSAFKHDGEEFLYVIGGRIERHYDGQVHMLATGASAYLDSRRRHRFRNRGPGVALVLGVNFVYRRF